MRHDAWFCGLVGQSAVPRYFVLCPFPTVVFYRTYYLFLFTKFIKPNIQISKKQIIHLVPGILYLLYSLLIFANDCFIVKETYFYSNGMDKDFEQWYQISGQISMAFYFLISLNYYFNYKKLVVEVSSNANALLFEWIKNYLIAFLIMLVLPILFDVLGIVFPEIKSYKGSWWFYFLYSIVLLYIAITGYSNNAVTKIGFQFKFYEQNLVYYLTESLNSNIIFENIVDIKHEVAEDIDDKNVLKWKTAIENLIVSESLFKNSELTLIEIAKKLETNIAII